MTCVLFDKFVDFQKLQHPSYESRILGEIFEPAAQWFDNQEHQRQHGSLHSTKRYSSVYRPRNPSLLYIFNQSRYVPLLLA